MVSTVFWLLANLLAPVFSSTVRRQSDSITDWTHLGCYLDGTPGRTLQAGPIRSPFLTQEWCIESCGGDGFSYAGVEFGQECWCDHLISNKNLTVDQSQCNMPCIGNASETCGAGNRIDIWHNPTVPDPSVMTQIGPWKYMGCFADSTSMRILNNPVSVGGILTPQKCFDACRAQGYGVAGLEFASECWCDKFLYFPGDPVPAEDEVQFCSMTCNGDSTQFCGGSAYLEIYVDTSVTGVDGCLDLTPRWDFTMKVGLRDSASDANMSATVIHQTDGFDQYLLAACTETTCTDGFGDYSITDGMPFVEPRNDPSVPSDIYGIFSGEYIMFAPHNVLEQVPLRTNFCPMTIPGSPTPLQGPTRLEFDDAHDVWSICPNYEGTRMDIIYRPLPGTAEYDVTTCVPVYLYMYYHE